MLFLQTNITPVLTFLTFISNIVFVLGVLLMVFSQDFRRWAYGFVYEHITVLLFGASLVAVIASLSYSEIIGFPPCDLCWFQRIFMYPQVLLSAIAVVKRDKGIVPYLLSLSIVGAAISLFHSLIHWGFHSSLLTCSAVNAPCAKVYVHEYGYITIPFMAFTIFVYLITLIVIYYKAKKYAGK